MDWSGSGIVVSPGFWLPLRSKYFSETDNSSSPSFGEEVLGVSAILEEVRVLVAFTGGRFLMRSCWLLGGGLKVKEFCRLFVEFVLRVGILYVDLFPVLVDGVKSPRSSIVWFPVPSFTFDLDPILPEDAKRFLSPGI